MKRKAILAMINGAILFSLILAVVYLMLKMMDKRFDHVAARLMMNERCVSEKGSVFVSSPVRCRVPESKQGGVK